MKSSKREPVDAARDAFRDTFSAQPQWTCRAPGRVNLIGEHVDYNEGLVLPVAIDLEIGLAFRRRDDRRVRIHSLSFDETAEFDIDDLAPGSPVAPPPPPSWSVYPAAVAWAMRRAHLPLLGIDATIAGDIPPGAGLSSSAAVEIAFAAAFRQVADLGLSDLELARHAHAAENDFVGVRCGMMDQIASACARRGRAALIDCRSLEVRHIALPPALRMVIVDSGVDRELRDSEYNQRRLECEEAARRLAALDDGIASLRDVPAEAPTSLLDALPAPLDRRARHVVGEIERVRLAAAALENNETERFGELLFASHRSLRDDFEVSCEELDTLVELGRQAAGVIGSRLTGAGFGGCTVNVVSAALVSDFRRYVADGYERLYGRRPRTWVSDPAPGVSVDPVW
ncbi:MAG: galactokinase [Gemmatimonadetes bacterium]|uniref:Galactokinase n=1 Tax=Candidatus Kutchimonas denitrificans TaxID=3056748 RepID=A0AAE4Z6X8_9BACT|nr:galactokinase [Gemmatimonadota bacterium]NIR74859.1 galactokinase [Candidatus Kutchimonas denitrificans]NIR99970.1 galactokinase [Gemmatimonadota bacterium]NIT65554.1 galactokinase [Gemmatimonadota bacterium]NIU52524.1 galactokinase [Gemmatimonadota bacterium]